jgi:hypothetical protein
MGSFTSMPKVPPGPDAEDADLQYPEPNSEDVDSCLKRCSEKLAGMPGPIQRVWNRAESAQAAREGEEKIRVLQWNVLSQGMCHTARFCAPKMRRTLFYAVGKRGT